MKKTLATILFSLFCITASSTLIAPIAYAQDLEVTTPCDPKSKGNEILPCETVFEGDPDDGPQRNLLPTSNAKYSILPQAIRMVLAIAGAGSIVVFVYAGVMLVVSQGNEEQLTKFKNVLIYSIIGLLLVTTSYGLIRGIMQLVFK